MKAKFESEFELNEKEITVLLKDECNGACVLEKKWLTPSVDFIAGIFDGSDDVVKKEGRIEWLIEKNPEQKGWGYDFEQYGIYRLLVRKSIPKQLSEMQSEAMNNRYMLVKVLEENVHNDKLEEIREYLMKPVVIETPYAEFELDRSFSWFSADVDFGECEVNVSMETDEENGETAEGALEAFNRIAADFEEFDRRNRKYASEYLLELANDWLEDDDREDKPEEITEEMFMDAIEMSEMIISPDGSLTVYYLDGDMFWGHVIEMSVEPDGTCSGADIAG